MSHLSGLSDVRKVYSMLTPKPKPLLTEARKLIRHGELIYFSPNTMSKKPRYFFLFDTCLLLTKKKSSHKYWLKVFIYLGPNMKLISDESDTQFRLVTAAGQPIIMFGRSLAHKEPWVRDLKHCLWLARGKPGPDPALGGSDAAAGATTKASKKERSASGKDTDRERRRKEREERRSRRASARPSTSSAVGSASPASSKRRMPRPASGSEGSSDEDEEKTDSWQNSPYNSDEEEGSTGDKQKKEEEVDFETLFLGGPTSTPAPSGGAGGAADLSSWGYFAGPTAATPAAAAPSASYNPFLAGGGQPTTAFGQSGGSNPFLADFGSQPQQVPQQQQLSSSGSYGAATSPQSGSNVPLNKRQQQRLSTAAQRPKGVASNSQKVMDLSQINSDDFSKITNQGFKHMDAPSSFGGSGATTSSGLVPSMAGLSLGGPTAAPVAAPTYGSTGSPYPAMGGMGGGGVLLPSAASATTNPSSSGFAGPASGPTAYPPVAGSFGAFGGTPAGTSFTPSFQPSPSSSSAAATSSTSSFQPQFQPQSSPYFASSPSPSFAAPSSGGAPTNLLGSDQLEQQRKYLEQQRLQLEQQQRQLQLRQQQLQQSMQNSGATSPFGTPSATSGSFNFQQGNDPFAGL
ncbi:NUP214 domain-containing protein [Balamuthia mandrillaris]